MFISAYTSNLFNSDAFHFLALKRYSLCPNLNNIYDKTTDIVKNYPIPSFGLGGSVVAGCFTFCPVWVGVAAGVGLVALTYFFKKINHSSASNQLNGIPKLNLKKVESIRMQLASQDHSAPLNEQAAASHKQIASPQQPQSQLSPFFLQAKAICDGSIDHTPNKEQEADKELREALALDEACAAKWQRHRVRAVIKLYRCEILFKMGLEDEKENNYSSAHFVIPDDEALTYQAKKYDIYPFVANILANGGFINDLKIPIVSQPNIVKSICEHFHIKEGSFLQLFKPSFITDVENRMSLDRSKKGYENLLKTAIKKIRKKAFIDLISANGHQNDKAVQNFLRRGRLRFSCNELMNQVK